MSLKESEEQLKSLIEHFNNGGLDFNATDIEAIKNLLTENQILRVQVSSREEVANAYKQIIEDAIDRLNALIIFWKKYNPIDNTMQIEQFKGVIEILEGVKEWKH